jgi:hypothetical protein
MEAFIGILILVSFLFWLSRVIRGPRASEVSPFADVAGGIPAPSRQKKLTYSERIAIEKSALMTGEGSASLETIEAQEIGYRPVGSENVLAVEWAVERLELKSTGRYSTGGMSVSIPIVKGVRWRIGSGKVRGEKTMQVTGRGRLIVTDKAIVFESPEKNERITWGQIAGIEFFSDGYQVAKRSGPPRTFSIKAPDPKFAAVLELMLSRV